MDYNEIDITPVHQGWGQVWQGGSVDATIKTLPGPLIIICMDLGEDNNQWIDHQTIQAVVSVWINDSPDAVLPDNVLLSLVRACVGYLESGVNLYIHCAAGMSRSSYMDIALHMTLKNLSYQDAYNLVHTQRPVINPNSGFQAQLQRLEPQLKNLVL